ncbi:siderophore-interacting protein [Pantoea sp.]|uniref:siderophore-interacting protein n=1 Tax=Pantoea sp. TaxID=69393 RepID=UPI0031D7DFE9
MSSVLGYRVFNVTLLHKTWLSPSFMRCVFTGADVGMMKMDGPDQRIKLLFPSLSGQAPALASNRSWWEQLKSLPQAHRPIPRTYTLRGVEAAECLMDVEFAIHGREGIASAWAIDATPGDTLQIVAPNRQHIADSGGYEWRPHPNVERALIVADETALPAVKGILEQMAKWANPPKMQIFQEIPLDEDRLDWRAYSFAEVHWLPRDKAEYGAALLSALKDRAVIPAYALNSQNDDIDDEGDLLWRGAENQGNQFYGWVAAESSSVKHIRRYLVGERHVASENVSFMAYWSKGKAC